MTDKNGVATINVCGNEVPLPAYWRMIDLWNEGKSNEEIVRNILKTTGARNYDLIRDVVTDVVDNQARMNNKPSNVKRATAIFKRNPKISAYRAARIEAEKGLQEAKALLETATKDEDRLVQEAFAKIKEKEAGSNAKAMDDPEVQRALERHHAAQAKVEHAKQLIQIHQSSLA